LGDSHRAARDPNAISFLNQKFWRRHIQGIRGGHDEPRLEERIGLGRARGKVVPGAEVARSQRLERHKLKLRLDDGGTLPRTCGLRRLDNAGMASLAVSAVIPTYNRERLIPRAIRSALGALSPGDEVVVVDDGSTDGTAAVVEAFGPPVHLLRLPHGGAGAARNAGFALARGPLVAFLDSDDEWFPDKVALQRSFLERRPDVLFACSDFGVRLEDGTVHRSCLPQWLSSPRPLSSVFGPGISYSSVAPLPPGREDFSVYVASMYLEEMRNNLISAFTLMVRKAEAAEALRFADDLPTCEEWPAFGRLSRLGAGALFDTETAWQHGHSGPRLTQHPVHVWAEAWLLTLERVWGSDPSFLAEHGEDFRRAVAEANLMRALSLIRHGDVREARRALRRACNGPIDLRSLWHGVAAKYDLRVWGRGMEQRRSRLSAGSPVPGRQASVEAGKSADPDAQ
jgi:glycosyltransferase involved in cell wall biosynthesis